MAAPSGNDRGTSLGWRSKCLGTTVRRDRLFGCFSWSVGTRRPAGHWHSSAVRGGHCRSAVAHDRYPGIIMFPAPLLVLDTQLRNYPRMGRPPGDRVPNIHLLRLRNGLRRFVG
jgi:hypothetical protein